MKSSLKKILFVVSVFIYSSGAEVNFLFAQQQATSPQSSSLPSANADLLNNKQQLAPSQNFDMQKNEEMLFPERQTTQQATDEQTTLQEFPPLPQADFRGVFWDMNRTQVLNKELLPLFKEDKDRLAYKGDYLGYQVHIYYLFENNRLVSAQIVFPSSFAYFSSRLKIFAQVKKQLQQQWGNPTMQDTYSNDNYTLTETEQSELENEIAQGSKQELTAEWNLKRSFVRLKLSGEKATKPRLYLLLAYYKNLPPPTTTEQKVEDDLSNLQKQETNLQEQGSVIPSLPKQTLPK